MKIIMFIFNKLKKLIHVTGVKKTALVQSGKKFPPERIVNILTCSAGGCRHDSGR